MLPTLKVDAASHAALMFLMDKTGDSLANLINQLLILGLEEYGYSPRAFKRDPRTPTDVEKTVSKRNLLLRPGKALVKGFRVPADLLEDVRMEQGKRPLAEVMAEAMQKWLEWSVKTSRPTVKTSSNSFAHEKRAKQYEQATRESGTLELTRREPWKPDFPLEKEWVAVDSITVGWRADSQENAKEGDFC